MHKVNVIKRSAVNNNYNPMKTQHLKVERDKSSHSENILQKGLKVVVFCKGCKDKEIMKRKDNSWVNI